MINLTFRNRNVIIYSNIPNKYMKNKILAELEFGSIINEVRYNVEKMTGVDVKNVDIYVDAIRAD